MVDALGSGPSVLTVIGVQVSSRVLKFNFDGTEFHGFCAFLFNEGIILFVIFYGEAAPGKVAADLMTVAVGYAAFYFGCAFCFINA